MMRVSLVTTLVVGGILMGMTRVQAADPDWRTRPPITYVLDYGQGHIGEPDYIEAVAGSPPMLLHLGKDVVMSHNWGPIQGVGGENQAGGRGDAIRRLTPEETWERYHALEQMVDDLHAAGVRWVMPYICSITLGGSHIRRTGFWEFYDHWDEYSEFGLPPRPELDPADWMQRDPDGSMKSTYGVQPDEDDFYPPYEPNMRYAACVNNPGWRTWIDSVARLVAAVGYDGAFIDNGGTQQCYCRFCQAKYQDWLRGRYSDQEIQELFGAAPGEDVPLSLSPERGAPVTLGWVESRRFWRHSIHEHQQAIKRAALEVTDHFILFPNGGHGRPASVKNSFQDSDYIMYELSVGDYGTNPGLVRSRIVGDIHMNVRNDHTWQLKYTAAVRERVSPLLLTRGGWPQTRQNLVLNADAARLGNAEAAAFGSGAGFLLRPRWDQYREVLNEYRAFFEDHAALYTGLLPYARVAVATFGDQNLYEHKAHVSSAREVTQELLAAHLLFDYVTEERFTAETLRGYEAVVFADVKYVDPEQIAALESYVEAGGRAIIVGEAPTHDLLVRPLAPPDLPEALRPLEEGQSLIYRRQGEGSWLRMSRLPLDGLGAVVATPEETLAAGYSDLDGLVDALETEDATRAARAASVAPEAGPGVRLNAFIDPEAGSPLILHVLNYDTPLGADPEPVADRTNLQLRVPLPEGAQVTSVTAFSPDRDEPLSLGYDLEDGVAVVLLPSLHIYEVLRIELG